MSEKINKDFDINKEVLDLITVVKSIVTINENLSKEVERLSKEVETLRSAKWENNLLISEQLKSKFIKYLTGKVATSELLENEQFMGTLENLCSTFSPELLMVICLTLPHGQTLEAVLE